MQHLFIGKTFENFDEFLQVLNEYSNQTYSIWTTYNSKKLDDDTNKYKFAHLKCIFFRDESKIVTTSKGTRPKQGYVAPHNCQAEIRLNYVLSGRNKDKYEITKCHLEHDRINNETNQIEEAHKLNDEDFAKHPSNRRLTEDEEKEIYEHFETGGDAKMIAMTMSTKTKKWLTTRDVWNIRNKLSKKDLTKDDHPLKAFENVMNERISIDNHNNFKLVYEQQNSKTLLMVYYQSLQMKKLYAQYGEIVFIDGTYCLNQNNYPVYLIVVRDCNGNSQIVAFAIVAYERQLLLDRFIDIFSQLNDIQKTNTIMIDKDLTEWNVLKKYLASADIFYCKFHCEQIFRRSIKNKELLPKLSALLNCDTEINFQDAYEDLIKSIDWRDKTYLEKNWLQEDQMNMWIKYKRIGKITLDNDTNNSVETLNSLLKNFIKRKTTLDKCLLGVLKLDDYLRTKYSYNEFNQRTKIIIDRTQHKDKYIDIIYKLFTPYAAKIVHDSYILSGKASYKVEFKDANVTLTSSKNTSTVYDFNSNKPRCSCFDFGCSLLPCRHIIHIRKEQNLNVITREMVNERWMNRKFENAQFQILEDQVDGLSYVDLNSLVTKQHSNKQKSTKTDSNSRFNECKRIVNEIAQLVSGDSEDVFHDRMEQLLIIKEMWQKNINFTLKPVVLTNVNDDDMVNSDDLSTYNAIVRTEDVSISEPIDDQPEVNERLDLQPTNSLQGSVEKINLVSTELARNVPKRGAPTLKERKRKAKANTITIQKSKSFKSNDESELKAFLEDILLDDYKASVDLFVSKDRVIDEEHIQVIPSKINPKLITSSFVNSDGEISPLISNLFSTDALLMLQNTLKTLRSEENVNSCKLCTLICDSKFIVCTNCNNFFHLKCVKKSYVPKLKKWYCANCSTN